MPWPTILLKLNLSDAFQMKNLIAADCDHVLDQTRDLWAEFNGKRLFLTGGTGFFGCWLLASLTRAIDVLGLDTKAVVLTRNPNGFKRKAPYLASHPSVALYAGDVRSFPFPTGKFSHVIHAATDADAALNHEHPLLMLDTIVNGTRHTLDFACACSAEKFLLTSSGAVYGPQPPSISHIQEDYGGAPNPLDRSSAYGEGKRMAEYLCGVYAKQYGIQAKVARCFAFVGPYLPLDKHFAIGNFICDGLRGGPIRVNSDGTPFRSYLYAADLVIWLWTILTSGATCRPYNVGSENDLSIGALAKTVAACFDPAPEVCIIQRPDFNKPPQRYVPSTQRAKIELNLKQTIDLQDAITRVISFCRQLGKIGFCSKDI